MPHLCVSMVVVEYLLDGRVGGERGGGEGVEVPDKVI